MKNIIVKTWYSDDKNNLMVIKFLYMEPLVLFEQKKCLKMDINQQYMFGVWFFSFVYLFRSVVEIISVN